MELNSIVVYVGADHAGYALKEYICTYLRKYFKNYEIVDCGTNSEESCDFPKIAKKTIERVGGESNNSFGILCCGSGTGMAIAANRRKGIRAANCWCVEIAKLAREHNNANVLVLAGRFLGNEEAVEITEVFLKTRFSNLERYSKRNMMLDDIR